MTTNVPVSTMVFTLNEEKNLPLCLDSLRWCDDVIVVDSNSDDKTQDIARSYDARVFCHPFSGFGDQRNWALDHCSPKHSWILVLDADERVTKELRDELTRVISFAAPDVAAYRIKRRFYMWGRWLRYSSLYPSYVVRLIRLGRVRYVNRGHAETQTVDGRTAQLQCDLIDENLKGMEEWFERQNRYSTKDAIFELDLESKSLRLSSCFSGDPLVRRTALKQLGSKLPGRPLFYFIYSYIFRGGFRDGHDGFMFCMMRALYQGMVSVKKYDIARRGNS